MEVRVHWLCLFARICPYCRRKLLPLPARLDRAKGPPIEFRAQSLVLPLSISPRASCIHWAVTYCLQYQASTASFFSRTPQQLAWVGVLLFAQSHPLCGGGDKEADE